MDSKRIAFVSVLGAAFLACATDPALAAGYDSATEEIIQSLNTTLLYMAIPITVLVQGILIYTVVKFRDNDDPQPTKENRRLEITWTVATAIVLVFVGYASYTAMAADYVAPNQVQPDEGSDAVEVNVTAQRYFWSFEYSGENVTTQDTMVIPANRTVYINVTSRDWLHSFHVPDLGLKQDAVPNQYHVLRTKATDTGEYQLYCAEYCGVGHSQMLGTVRVVSQDRYQQWLNEQSGGGGTENSSDVNAAQLDAPAAAN